MLAFTGIRLRVGRSVGSSTPGPQERRQGKSRADAESRTGPGCCRSTDPLRRQNVDRVPSAIAGHEHEAIRLDVGARLGKETFEYFAMLLGEPGVKADIMIRRFVGKGNENAVSASEARRLVKDVASRMAVNPIDLDHAIWAYQRKNS